MLLALKILRKLNDKNSEVRKYAVERLGYINHPKVVSIVAKTLKHDKEPEVQKAAARSLGKIRHLEAIITHILAIICARL